MLLNPGSVLQSVERFMTKFEANCLNSFLISQEQRDGDQEKSHY